ncbi:MAG: tRNA-dihydrouridine synthase family protein [Bdellovibrionaceae bacterium]|nr:tRNA-dihydrouridine synthase family protein [Pseudobdellovibrionaceae bacterium]
MKLYLAPMEGVTDFVMRDLLTQSGVIDKCFTEFLRVTQHLHPHSVFYKNCPELKMGSRTRAGTPVFLQLLGGQAQPLAENAARAAELGALGIDLNFGCPAKTVNRHDGGAVLLQYPQRLYDIVKQVRAAVPRKIPVSAKMRLGFQDTSLALENAQALNEAGAASVTVHCRTKIQGYRPPAHWEWIPKLSERLSIPVVANGDIASLEDFNKCREVTSSQHFMIGRGAISNPLLFTQIRNSLQKSELRPGQNGKQGSEQKADQSGWQYIKPMIPVFFEACTTTINMHFATARTKQWMRVLAPTDPEAKEIFDRLKALKAQDFQKGIEELSSSFSTNDSRPGFDPREN